MRRSRGAVPDGAAGRPPTLVEGAIGRARGPAIVVLIAAPLVCWAWIVVMARDMYGSMTGASAWMMTAHWDATHLLLLWAMWAVMMAGMMLPSAAPLILLFGAAARRDPHAEAAALRIYALAAGYLAAWTLFSLGATALQRALARLLVVSPMMEVTTAAAGATLLALAGAYQFTPLKQACLRMCRSPLGFLTSRWRPGAAGAFRLGAAHGAYCVGCCWALMLLLFAGGVMNLSVIVALTVFVLIEKLAPFGARTAPVSGVLLIGAAAWTLLR
jgi:predicted metal-binding membrane protein